MGEVNDHGNILILSAKAQLKSIFAKCKPFICEIINEIVAGRGLLRATLLALHYSKIGQP